MNTVLTVAAINRYLASRIKEDKLLRGLMIKGEISNFKKNIKSGHMYFTLKDNEAAVKAVMFKGNADDLSFTPEDGMSVIVTGSIQVYERDGVYQIYCTDIEPDGAGKLFTSYEKLKRKLSDEGLFDSDRKKPLPLFPEKIGIITAEGAAALRDMVTVLGRRAPYVKLTLYNTSVQGINAAKEIAEQIKAADSGSEDLLIVGRGGGSFEDLFAFSDEAVVRAVANAKTPIITAVGHETDTMLCDFAADLRAPTPSAAAELAVSDTVHILVKLEDYFQRFYDSCLEKIEDLEDDLDERSEKLRSLLPIARINSFEREIEKRQERLRENINARYKNAEYLLSLRILTADKLSPLKLLSRGYAIAEKDGNVITKANDLNTGDDFTVTFSDGQRKARVL